MSTVGKRFDEEFTGIKLNAEQVLSLIEENGGSEGLDLSGKDLSGIRLNPRALEQLRRDKGPGTDAHPVWEWKKTGGVNLQGANLAWAMLSGANLSKSNLRRVDFRGARLDGVDFVDADLQDAILWDANLDNAVLDGANLRRANLFGVNFFNTTLAKECLGESVIQESELYCLPSGIEMGPDRNRHWQGGRIYRALKANLDGAARYSEASWAYRKARRMEKHLAGYRTRRAWHNREWKQFGMQAWRRISDEVAEKLCDYGENWLLVLLWIGVVWLVFALLYGVNGGVQRLDSAGMGHTTRNVLDLLAFSLATMTTIEPVGLSASDVGFMRILMPLEVLVGIALTGLFGFVLGNRINRV